MSNKIGTIDGPCSWLEESPKTLERRTRVRVVRVEITCPACGKGTMEFTGSSWPVSPPGYHHKCGNCGNMEAIHHHQYPEIEYEEES